MRNKAISIFIIFMLLFSYMALYPTKLVLAADCSGDANTQFRSRQSGTWNSPASWECSDNGADWQVPDTQFPTSSNGNIVIRDSHTITATSAITVNQVYVENGGQITLNWLELDAFTLEDGSEEYDLIIDGIMLNEGRFQFSGDSKWRVNAGGLYIHHVQDAPSPITQHMVMEREGTFIYRYGPGILVEISPRRTYGNLIIETTSGSSLAPTANITATMTVLGDFIIGDNITYTDNFTGTAIFEGSFFNYGTLSPGIPPTSYQFTGVGEVISGTHTIEFDNLEVAAGASITFEQEVSISPGGTFTNDGMVTQTKLVEGSSDVGFFNMGGYGGVILNANSLDLGNTIMTIQGNQDCTLVADETVKRCFDITPQYNNGRDTTITFYFDSSEVVGSNTCDTLEVYHFSGGSWGTLALDPSYNTDGRLCGPDPQSVRVVDVATFSPIVLKTGEYPKLSTTTTIMGDTPDPSVVGESVEVNFTVAVDAPWSGTPSGDVTVTVDGSGATCSDTLVAGAGSCSIDIPNIGDRTITATYGGDANYNGSSDTEDHTVNLADTTTTITGDTPEPSVVGESVVVSFSVAVDSPGSGTPTGEVTVTVDGSGATCSDTLVAGAGSCSINIPNAGARTLTTTYHGDTNYNVSSDTEAHIVNLADTTTTIVSATPDPSVAGESVLVSFTVAADSPGGSTPTGDVTVTVDGSATTCSDTLVAGAGNCSIAIPNAGDHIITATYAGDTNYNGSSDTEDHTVNPIINMYLPFALRN